jgi:hypothetical protein
MARNEDNELDLDASYRCTVCAPERHCCLDCLRHEHDVVQWHAFEKWSDDAGCWTPFDLPVELRAHEGCVDPKSVDMRIFSVHGKHEKLSFVFCGAECTGQGAKGCRALQLLDYNLFPASPLQPRRAFTIDMLRLFNQLNSRQNVNALKFWSALFPKKEAKVRGLWRN